MTSDSSTRPLVLGIAGSPRARSDSRLLLEAVLAGAAAAGAGTELVSLRDLEMGSCRHCRGCDATGRCVVQDEMQQVYPRLRAAQHLALASPIHFAGVSAETKMMIDRGQASWVETYRLKRRAADVPGERRGLFIATCGGSDLRVFEWAKPTVKAFFNSTGFRYWGDLFEASTDRPPPVAERAELLARAEALGRALVGDRL